MTALTVDQAVAALARCQHGVFSHPQVIAAGGSPALVYRRLRSGAWVQVCSRVYALPSHPPSWFRQLKAAELSKDKAVVSGKAGAALHELPGFKRGRPEITVPPDTSGRCALATVHRSSFVEPVEVNGISCNSVRQTLFDVAGRVSFTQLGRAVDDGLRRGLVTTRELTDRCVDLAPTRLPGLPSMRAVLLKRGEDYVPPTNELERMLYALLDRLPVPYDRQAHFPWSPDGPQMVDACIPAWRLIVEADGRAWHTRMDDFARDRERDRLATENGYRPIRYDYWEILNEPRKVEAYLRRIGPPTNGPTVVQ